VEGRPIDCADSWPLDGDCEGAVVWISLFAPKNPPSISTSGLLPDPAGFYLTVSPFCLVERPTCLCLRQAVFFVLFCLIVLSRRFVSLVWIRFCLRQAVILPPSGCRFLSSIYHVLSRSISFVLPSSGRRFVLSFCLIILSRRFSVSLFEFGFAFVRPLFCLRQASVFSRQFVSSLLSRFVLLFCLVASVSRCFVSCLPSSGRRFASTGPSDLVFAVVTVLVLASHRYLCHLYRPTHPPHMTTIPAERGRGGRGTFRTGTCLWGGRGW
jgi:hypothetical protein